MYRKASEFFHICLEFQLHNINIHYLFDVYLIQVPKVHCIVVIADRDVYSKHVTVLCVVFKRLEYLSVQDRFGCIVLRVFTALTSKEEFPLEIHSAYQHPHYKT